MVTVSAPAQEIALKKGENEPLEFEIAAQVVGDRFFGYHNVDADHTAPYEVLAPDGERMLAGDWPVHGRTALSIPADAPAGVYRLRVESNGFDVPVSDVDEPEVIVVAPGKRVPASHREGGYWFMVPEGVKSFYVDVGFPHSRGRISIWDPDGERAWNFNFHSALHTDSDAVRAEVEVPSHHAGKLWRITVPGHGAGNFEMDPQIPPFFATGPSRWFDPELDTAP